MSNSGSRRFAWLARITQLGLFFAVTLTTLASCSGALTQISASPPVPAAELTTASALPAPVAPTSQVIRGTLLIRVGALGTFPHVNPVTTDPTRAGRTPQNVADNEGGGQAGFIINPGAGAGDGGIYVAMTAYDDAWVTTPTDGAYNLVNAPTTHGPNGNCMEVVTNYYNGFGTPGTTVDQIQFYDFCSNGGQGGFVGAIPIDATFVRDYIRIYADSAHPVPRYISAVVHSATDNRWHAYLYNASLMKYVDFYDSAAGASTNVLGAEGWSIFETHYNGGDCTTLPDASEESIQVHTSAGWHLLSGDAVGWYVYGTCFSDPASVPYYAPAYSTSPDVAWTVTSPVAPALSEYARIIRANSPTAYYRLGDTGTTVVDSSGNGATLNGGYGANVGRNAPSLLAVESLNGAARFPGGASTTASTILVPASPKLQPAGQVSIETWVQERTPNSAATNDLVSYGSRLTGLSYTLQLLANNTLAAFVTTSKGNGFVGGTTVLAPQRTYLADVTYDGAKVTLFVDGKAEASSPAAGSIVYAATTASNGLAIGSARNSTRPVFAGTLDEVAVFGTALTSAQIATHWTAGSGVAVAAASEYASVVGSDAPLAFYRLSDTTRVAVDSSANRINAAYGASVTPNVEGLLSTDPMENAAMFPGGASGPNSGISTLGNTKLEPKGSVSLETWIEPIAAGGGTIDLVSYGPQPIGLPYTLQLLANGTLGMFVTTTTGYGFVQGATRLTLDAPHLVDGTYDGSTLKVYVDGSLDGSGHASGSLNYTKQSASFGLSIGTAFNSPRNALRGVLGNVAVYGTALSAQRIGAHWTAGSGRAFAP